MQGTPYGAPTYSPQPSTAPRIGDWLSESFNLFGRQWQTWCLQGLIFSTIVGLLQIVVVFMVLGTSGFAAFQAMASSNGEASPAAILGFYASFYGGLFLGALVSLVPAAFLMAGMTRTAAKQLRGEPIAVGDLFSGGDVFGPALGGALLATLLAGLGSMLCIVPGLVLYALCFYMHPLIVERRMSVGEARQVSWDAVKPHLWMTVVWVLLVGVVSYAGSAVGCGIIATLPISILMMMVAFRDTLGLPGALPSGAAAQAMQMPQQPVYGAQYGPAGPPAAGGACPACGRAVAYGAVVCPYCQTPLAQQPQPGQWTPPSGPPAG